MTQVIAIFLDAYRELNAKKLFWITLIISGVVIGAFAFLGVTPTGLKLATWDIRVQQPGYWYRYVFSFVVSIWVAWGSIVLALISTAGIFPDFMAGGSIDLYFSKPISRLRLFILKYLTGLFFVALQATVFAGLAALIFGLRGGAWNSRIFLIIPIVLCVYSYLYAMTVLFGVWTRSTIAALLTTIVIWLLLFLVGWVEGKMYEVLVRESYIVSTLQKAVAEDESTLKTLKEKSDVTNAFGIKEAYVKNRRDKAAKQVAEGLELRDQIAKWHQFAYALNTVLPKTAETIRLFDRSLFDDSDLEYRNSADKEVVANMVKNKTDEEKQFMSLDQDAQLAAERSRRERSLPWILGTSFAFEAVVLGLAAWIFCRRDY